MSSHQGNDDDDDDQDNDDGVAPNVLSSRQCSGRRAWWCSSVQEEDGQTLIFKMSNTEQYIDILKGKIHLYFCILFCIFCTFV